MAHLSKKGPWFVARFTYQGREYKKSLKTRDHGDAQAVLHEVESRIHALLRGLKQVPPGIDPGDYIVWGDAAQDRKPPKPSAPSFKELAELYLAAHKELKAESTLDGETIHLNNLQACLGDSAKRPVDQLRHRDLEAALRERLRSVRGATVNKERRTLLSLFKWAVQQEHLDASPAATLPLFKTDKERPPFRTLEEIEEMLQRGGLSDSEIEEVWECLYLTQEQIGEVLNLVKDRGREDFVHPMFAIIAYTGMRRGEMLRLQWRDVDFRRGVVTARSRKQSRQRKETLRDIELHPELEAILRRYQESRPSGQTVICGRNSPAPLTKHQANHYFRQALRETRWERDMPSGKKKRDTPSGKKKVVLGFHTFRHSFASNLAAQGVDQRIIDRWMGHTTEAMRKRYQHLFPKKLSESIRKLSFNATKTESTRSAN